MIASRRLIGGPITDRLPESLISKLVESCPAKAFPKGTIVHQAGDPSESFSIVLSGRVSMSRRTEDGDNHVAVVFNTGEAFGVVPMLMKKPRTYDCEALEDCELVKIPQNTFWKVIDENPQTQQDIIIFLCERLARMVDVLEDERRLPLKQRLAKRLLEYTEQNDTVSITQSHLADQLGVTRNAIGTALKYMEEHSFITIGYGKLEISDRQKLKQWLTAR